MKTFAHARQPLHRGRQTAGNRSSGPALSPRRSVVGTVLRQEVSGGGGAVQGAKTTTCTTDEAKKTQKLAEDARIDGLGWVECAQNALDHLREAWRLNRQDILEGRQWLRKGTAVCAFDSNFNINQKDPAYGTTQFHLEDRLRQLRAVMSKPVAYACQPASDPNCQSDETGQTHAYVRGTAPKIYFCPPFRDDSDFAIQVGSVIHEFAHLCPGVGDAEYAFGDLVTDDFEGPGTTGRTCSQGLKFQKEPSVLTNTADAIAGFVAHIGLSGACVEQGEESEGASP